MIRNYKRGIWNIHWMNTQDIMDKLKTQNIELGQSINNNLE
jgi:hypothetical protein